MPAAEVQITDADFADRLKDMRLWLDARCFQPTTFTYFYLFPGMRVRIAFGNDSEAIAFAEKFDGIVLDVLDRGFFGVRRGADA